MAQRPSCRQRSSTHGAVDRSSERGSRTDARDRRGTAHKHAWVRKVLIIIVFFISTPKKTKKKK